MLKIAFALRADARAKPGGDVVQIEKYISFGRELRLFEGELIDDLAGDISDFDLVHLTNIDRPVDTWAHYRRALAAGKPVVLSSIHHSYREIERYESEGRAGKLARLTGALSFSRLEVLRSLVRCTEDRKLFLPTLDYLFRGPLSVQKEILSKVQDVLVLSQKEKSDLLLDFGSVGARTHVVRNGVEFDASEADIGSRDIDVCVVGRIEARKNQLLVLKILNRLGLRGAFVGSLNKFHRSYSERFIQALRDSNSEYVPQLPQAHVRQLLRRSKVHVSASWFEVASLVDLEAYGSGCLVVSSRCGSSEEVLGDHALYVDPGSEDDIESKIKEALQRARSEPCESSRLPLPTWSHSVHQLHHIYEGLVGTLR